MIVPPDRVQGALTFEFVRPPDRRYTFHSTLLHADEEQIVLAHEAFPSQPLFIGTEEVMAAGYYAVWFLFKGQPFDVARFYRPDGTWTGYYADILEPVRWEADNPETLEPIVDLFLDLWITPAGDHTVLDEDEFEDAVSRGRLSGEQEAHARFTVRQLIGETARGTFPPASVKEFRL